MERGDWRIAFGVLVFVGIVGVLGVTTMIKDAPTGKVMQHQGIYIVEDANADYAFQCQYPYNPPVFLGYQANYRVYCCPEDYNMGSNFCRVPHRTLITREY